MPESTSRRTTTAARGGFVYVPLEDVFYPKWKITITDQDSTVYTIADFNTGGTDNYLINASVTRSATAKLSSAVVKFVNPFDSSTQLGQFTNKFTGGEILQVYADYNDASTLIYRGKIDNVNHSIRGNSGYEIEVDSRDYPEMTDRTVIGQANTSYASTIILDILEESTFNDITLVFWNGTEWIEASYDSDTRVVTWSGDSTTVPTVPITMSWQNKKPWSVISEVCGRAGMDCFLEYDTTNSRWLLRTFIEDSVKNNSASVTLGNNIIAMNNFGPDNTEIYNHIVVYGKQESSNIITLATEQDFTSQANLWRKDKIITDSSLNNDSEVREKASYELTKGLVGGESGSFNIVGQPVIKQGEQIMISVPHNAVSGYYTIRELTHNISSSGFTTDIEVLRTRDKMSKIFREKIDIEREAEAYENLNDMSDSFAVFFDSGENKIDTLSNCEIVDGKLQLSAGETFGQATSFSVNTTFSITKCEMRKYSNFPIDEDDTYEVSNDNGVTWESIIIGSGSVHTFSNTENANNLRFRITLRRDSVNDPTPSYESVVVLYK